MNRRNKLEKSLKQISRFFEYGDLVPFAVLISSYNYAMALTAWGEAVIIAIAQGILIDMLHFRTVRQAVRSKTIASTFVAILTTVLSFGVHLLFYAYDAETGMWNLSIPAIGLALSLPVAIPVLAWLNQQDKDSVVVTAVKRVLNGVKDELKKVKVALNTAESKLKVAEDDLNQAKAKLKDSELLLKQSERLRKSQESELNELREDLKNLGPLGNDVVFGLLPGKETGAAIAKRHKISEAAVSGLKAKLNGGMGTP